MLEYLKVRNYAIIDEIEIRFSPHLNIITGETGAGKSILLGALGLILGNRADSKNFYNTEEKCVIEAEFRIGQYEMQEWFETQALDYADATLIRREIQLSGRNRVFINDTPVSLQQLQDFTSRLVDIHQQFSLFDIQKPAYQLELYDAYAGNKKEMESYRRQFRQYQQLKTELSNLEEEKKRALQEMDFIRFQLDEIEALKPESFDQESLESELQLLEHAGTIRQMTMQAGELLTGQEQSIVGGLSQLYQQFNPFASLNKQLETLTDRIHSSRLELEDLAGELEKLSDSVEMDPAREHQVRETLDQLYKLLNKHHLKSVTELIELQSELQTRSADFEQMDARINEKTEAITALEKKLESSAGLMSKNRKTAAKKFESSVISILTELGMPHAQLNIDITALPEFAVQGKDQVQFLFAANKGSKPAPIRDVASGGEISRLTLVIKSLVASTIPLPTLIFDEIDTGLGGEIALKMSQIMQQMATGHQLIVITHSPQIAAKADKHLFVFKEVIKNNTFTQIKTLDKAERIEAIAIMLSTRPPSKAAIANAKELIK